MSFALPFSFFLFSLEYSLIAPIDPAPMLHLVLAVTLVWLCRPHFVTGRYIKDQRLTIQVHPPISRHDLSKSIPNTGHLFSP